MGRRRRRKIGFVVFFLITIHSQAVAAAGAGFATAAASNKTAAAERTYSNGAWAALPALARDARVPLLHLRGEALGHLVAPGHSNLELRAGAGAGRHDDHVLLP